jgi:MFS family permease
MQTAVPLSGIPQRPTRARYGVVWFAVTLAIITYVDRVCITKTQEFIQKDLDLTRAQMGWVFTIFAWTYGLFEIPWGWLGDKTGARKVLMRIVVCWSIFTAATGWVWSLPSLLVTRALFGVGEAGAFPNITKTFTTWLPAQERVRAQGILWLAARWGGAFTPFLVVLMLSWFSWRRTFEIFGAIGIVWAFFFYRWYRDNPREHPGVNEAERELLPPASESSAAHGPAPWGRILGSRQIWLLCAQYFFLAFGAYFYMSWFPTYVKNVRGVTGTLGALLDGTPFFFMGIGSLTTGFLLAQFARWTGSTARARRSMAATGFLCSCLFLLLSIQIKDPVMAILVVGLAGFSNDLAMPPSWGASMDIGGRYAGTVSAVMNTLGCLGSGLFPIVADKALKWSGENWNMVFYVSAASYFLGMICWLFLDPVTPLEPKTKEATA